MARHKFLHVNRFPNREMRRDEARRAGFFGLPRTQVRPFKAGFTVDRRTPFGKRFPTANEPYVKPVV